MPRVRKRMLETLKKEVIRIALKAQREGMCKYKAGNFSSLDDETGYLVVTPSGVDREELMPDDIIVMDLNANVVEYKPGRKPSSEVLMHIAIYQARPDVRHIVHTHSKYATCFAVLNKPIPPIVNEMLVLGNAQCVIPVAPYGRSGSEALAEHVAATLKDADSILMQAHGALAVDETSLEGAYLKACYIEELAEVYHHTLAATGGQEPPVLPLEELKKVSYPDKIHFLQ